MSSSCLLHNRLKVSIVALVFGLFGCDHSNQYNDLRFVNVLSLSPIDKQSNQPKLAIAFGGGAARGMMHLGVIKALNDAGITADIVTGTSVGSIAAVLYSHSSRNFSDIESKMLDFNEREIIDMRLSKTGIIQGKALATWMNNQTQYNTIQQLPITTGIVATNLTDHNAIVFTQGNIGKAVQTSSSVPGVFMPVYHHDDILVDGGILSLVPVYAARQLGADIVIAVDVFCGVPPPLRYTAISTVTYSFWLQSCIATKPEIDSAEIVITPTSPDENLLNFGGKAERSAALLAGYEAMNNALPELKRQLKSPR